MTPTGRRSLADTGVRHCSSESCAANAASPEAPSSMRLASASARLLLRPPFSLLAGIPFAVTFIFQPPDVHSVLISLYCDPKHLMREQRFPDLIDRPVSMAEKPDSEAAVCVCTCFPTSHGP